ncbi:MAG: MBL fold metallo-hydrolase [Rhodospirillaceae bacterium]|jgi:glyoxylase-like metal-dependent hydrolase (beta-lactamase superfamily II)|nr:MBL fold metallo-hydrolase [Rhodospirillaceae bacterium]MBT5455891.1 MBL fold metallo-hydrolase [Rhodospirillaceae bacterium]
MTILQRVGGLTLAFILVISAGAAWAQKAPKRSITKIAGDLYRFQNNFHFSVFYVTPAGVLVTDPINAGAAKWLKAEIKKRFNQPIKYLVYSHDHQDHSSGGEVFAGATVVGHELTRAAMTGEKRPTPAPTVTFSDKMTLHLGGRQINLVYVGKGHSDNSIAVHFPRERTVFAVDFVSVKRMPFKNLSDTYIPDLVNQLRMVENMDFDIIAPGHGKTGTRADVRDHREYVEALYGAVLAATRAGQSLDQMKQSIQLPKYASWSQYKAWLPLNIEGIYSRITLQRRATR